MQSATEFWIVEDDATLAQSLLLLFSMAQVGTPRLFASAEACLQEFQTRANELALKPGCLLLDIRLNGMSGTELFAQLKTTPWHWPVIFMTGHGDLSMAVDLLKQGAADYLTKPCDPMEIVNKVKAATALSEQTVERAKEMNQHLQRLRQLTPHECYVFKGILKNLSNREIAEQMQNSVRTIEAHRAKVFKKMEVSSAIELAQAQERFILNGGKTPF
jgi:two-component system response regulator DctR